MTDITLDGYKAAYRENAKDAARRDFRRHVAAYILVNTGLTVFNLLVSPGTLWFYWSWFGWGIGLVGHFVSLREADEKLATHEALAEDRARRRA